MTKEGSRWNQVRKEKPTHQCKTIASKGCP